MSQARRGITWSWLHAEDADEARSLAKAGVMPVGMDGGSITY